ncbi:MAG TPA: ParA family protein [Arenimonas sp.]|nr:ParA family protein [Arenimonas sp.]
MIITVSNNKGGVGKTALAAHLAFRAAEAVKVLAVDLDSQANFSATLFDRHERRGHASADQLFTEIELPEPIASGHRNIDLLPAAPALASTDRLNLSAAFQAMTHLKALAKQYPVIVIDTAPALGLRMTAALACAHQVVVPLVPESYSVDGVATVLSEIASIGENLNPAMKPADFVLNLMNPQAKQHRRIAERIAGNFKVATPWLNRSVAVADALAERRPVWRNPSNRRAAEQWRELTGRLLVLYGVLESESEPMPAEF